MLIPLAVLLLGVAVAFFIWSVKTGQFDDLEGPAHRILMDDDDPMIPGYGAHSAERGSASGKDEDRKGG